MRRQVRHQRCSRCTMRDTDLVRALRNSTRRRGGIVFKGSGIACLWNSDDNFEKNNLSYFQI
jgi:hypothetical protein